MSGNSMLCSNTTLGVGTCKAPYTNQEKLLLVQLVKENPVIENKRTDGTSLTEKKLAWDYLTQTYNSQPEVATKRTSDQLKKLWNNIKQRKRKENTMLRHSMLATGGGPMEKPNRDEVLEFVDDTVQDITIDCAFDSTALFEKGIPGTSKADGIVLQGFPEKRHADDEMDATTKKAREPKKAREHFSSKIKQELLFSDNTCVMIPAARTVHEVDVLESANTPCTKAVGVVPQVIAEKKRFDEIMNSSMTDVEKVQEMKFQILREEMLRAESLRIQADAEKELSLLKLHEFKKKFL